MLLPADHHSRDHFAVVAAAVADVGVDDGDDEDGVEQVGRRTSPTGHRQQRCPLWEGAFRSDFKTVGKRRQKAAAQIADYCFWKEYFFNSTDIFHLTFLY